MFRTLSWLLATTLFVTAAAAQDPTVASKRESKLTAEVVAALHEFADAYEAQRQHATALALRKEILLEYDENNEKARENVGFTKVGELWQPDPGKLVIGRDLSGNKKELKKIGKKFDRFRKDQLREHRAVAQLWTRAGNAGRAAPHWRRVLALDPEDDKAVQALALELFQGFRGSADELHMLRRAWTIRGAVEWLHRHEIPVQKIEGRESEALARAQVTHQGYMTENFEVWGTLPADQLTKVAQHCERVLLMFRTIFGTCEGHTFEPPPLRGLMLVADQATYSKVLDAHADQFDASRLAFLKNDVDMAFLTAKEGRQWRCIKTNGSYDEAFDQAVRGVSQDLLECLTEGLWEGIGHAGCGTLFGKTITFLLEQQDARTVGSWAKQMLVPDIKVWMDIAAKSAWSKSDTRTSELVLISAARFTTEQRVKAWAICDYLFHWRPELVRQLDLSKTEDIETPPDVEREFERRTGVKLTQIDADWRTFWSRQEDLRRAMYADPLGGKDDKLRSRREQARALVDAVNELRAAGRRGPVGYYFAENAAVQAALNYGDKLVKVERDRRRKPKQEFADPALPTEVGHSVLFGREEAAAAVLRWWANPAWRDAMVHPGRGLLGANEGNNGLVLDLSEPVQQTKKGPPQAWPRRRQQQVPRTALVADLGPRAIAALAAHGKAPTDTVAMPWTLHFARAVPAAQLAEVEARVYYDGVRVQGVLVSHAEGEVSDTAPGCLAFVGFEPPAAGIEVEVNWRLPSSLRQRDDDEDGEGEQFPAVRFLVK